MSGSDENIEGEAPQDKEQQILSYASPAREARPMGCGAGCLGLLAGVVWATITIAFVAANLVSSSGPIRRRHFGLALLASCGLIAAFMVLVSRRVGGRSRVFLLWLLIGAGVAALAAGSCFALFS